MLSDTRALHILRSVVSPVSRAGISSLASTRDILCVAHEDGTINIVDCDGHCLAYLKGSLFSGHCITALCWSSSNTVLAAAGTSLHKLRWSNEARELSLERSWNVAEDEINQVHCARDVCHFVDDTGAVATFDCLTEKLRKSDATGHHEQMCTAFVPLGSAKHRHYISGGMDCKIKLWPARLLAPYHTMDVSAIQRSDEGGKEALASIINPPYVNCIVGDAAEGRCFCVGLGDSTILVVRKHGTGKGQVWLPKVLSGHKRPVGALAMLDKKLNVIVSGSDDCCVKAWNTNTLHEISSINIGAKANAIAIIGDLIVVGDVTGKLTFLQWTSAELM